MSASLRLAELLKFVCGETDSCEWLLVRRVVVCGLQLLVGCTNTGASEQ
jgi:hypothetical protein